MAARSDETADHVRGPEPRPDQSTTEVHAFHIRVGSHADAPLVTALFDEAIQWMIDRDLTDQWGRQPFSSDPRRRAAVTRWISEGELRIAQLGGEPLAAMVLGDAPGYAPPARGPELYVVALVSSRTDRARGAGKALLLEAESVAAGRGLALLRLDCFAGNGGALVRYYQRAGFTPTERFDVGPWPGQVLERMVRPRPLATVDP